MSTRRRKPKAVIAAATGTADTTCRERAHQIYLVMKEAAERAERDGVLPDSAEGLKRAVAARTKGRREADTLLAEGRLARERQRAGRLEGTITNKLKAAERHAEWQQRAEAVWRVNPGLSETAVAQKIAPVCRASASAVRRNICKP